MVDQNFGNNCMKHVHLIFSLYSWNIRESKNWSTWPGKVHKIHHILKGGIDPWNFPKHVKINYVVWCWSLLKIRLTATELKKFMLCTTIPLIYISFELIIYRLSGDVDKPRYPVLSQESLTQWWERPNFNAGQHWSCPLSKMERGYLHSGRMCLM